MRKTILQKEIADITRQIVKKYKPQKIILFGSAARGEFGPDSDLDFLIIKKGVPERKIDRMRELRFLLEYTIASDFFIYRPDEIEERINLGDPFIKTILKEGEVLHG